MDLLYSKYSNPLEFMRLYIEQGRFGEFVESILLLENKKRKEEAEKEDEDKLFEMYVHSLPDKSFIEWKDEVLNRSNSVPEKTVSKEDVLDIINESTRILDGFDLK